jgi:hypothetical protein
MASGTFVPKAYPLLTSCSTGSSSGSTTVTLAKLEEDGVLRVHG